MRERPILFSGPMVRAILDGSKTQTRRVVGDKWLPVVEECLRVNGKWLFSTMEYDLTTPFGEPGDRLWVRETHQFVFGEGGKLSGKKHGVYSDYCDEFDVRYAADPDVEWNWDGGWRPSIHMPRWASRLALEITDIRVERMQDGGDREFWGKEKWAQNPLVWVVEFRKLTDAEGVHTND